MAVTLQPVVVVHGGAGQIDVAARAAHVAGCERAAALGLERLHAGGTSLDAVQAAVEALELDPLYNAGIGASLTEAGTIELDAALMEGTTARAGGVCVLPPFLHPIRIARAVLEDGRHVLLAAEGAAEFALEQGFETAPLSLLRTEKAVARLARWRAGAVGEGWAGGTVGAVACDREGRVAAATSTGGTVGKRLGRVGDSPILGAGTWADDRRGACSTTGVGEAMLRMGLARSACEALRPTKGKISDPEKVAQEMMSELAERFEATGGLILVTPDGRVGIAHSTETMSTAVAR